MNVVLDLCMLSCVGRFTCDEEQQQEGLLEHYVVSYVVAILAGQYD